MRATIAALIFGILGIPGILGIGGLTACGSSENAGAEAARRQAEAEQAASRSEPATPAKRVQTPVPAGTRVPCTQLIDLAAFQTALGEKQPLTIKDITASERDATTSCSLVRGGKRPTEAEQTAMQKRTGKLGVLPGDELCNVSAFCWTIESTERLRARCKERKELDDESMGSYACVRIVVAGPADVKVFRFFDDDTRCILQVRGGPSNVNNDLIQSCAKAARDSIGPAQIDQIQVEPAGDGSAG
jgi:hypothetical protein